MRTHRQLAGVSLAALAVVLVLPHRVAAAGFLGEPNAPNGVIIDRSAPNIDTIIVGRTQATINWVPTDAGVGGGPINFLPNGNTANFVAGSGVEGSYTVLNRILAADPSRSISFDGAVNSAAGGAVWFYAPGGILLGANARFNVGSLLLTTGDPFADSETGDFISRDNSGNSSYRVTNLAGSTAQITLTSGAQINALAKGSYVVAVAPRISQAGAINVNGTAALVAAEAVDFTYNAGLFDIVASEGTAGAAGAFSHTGTTTGAAATDGDLHRIYLVAIPKNTAMTMFISTGAGQQLGFDVAGAANVDGNAVVLSAGYDVAEASGRNPEFPEYNTVFADRPRYPIVAAGIAINRGNFTSAVNGLALGNIYAGDTGGNLSFASNVTLRSDVQVDVVAQAGRTLTIGGDASIDSSTGFQSSNGASHIGGNSFISAEAGATLTIGGDATVSADGYGDFGEFLSGSGTGGIANITASGGSITITGDALVSARGGTTASEGFTSDGGNGTGGKTFIVAKNAGTLSIGGLASLDSQGSGGYGELHGGIGTGGTNTVSADSGGTLTVGSSVESSARGYGGETLYGTAAAGRGQGGLASLRAGPGGSTIIHGNVTLDAMGTGGDAYNYGGEGGSGGIGTGGTASIRASGGNVTIDGEASVIAMGIGAANSGELLGSGGDGNGGETFIQAFSDGDLTIAGLATLDSKASGGNGHATAGNAIGGTNTLNSDNGGTLTVGSVDSFSRANGGIGYDAGGVSGSGRGGIVSLGAGTNGTTIVLGDVTMKVPGRGGSASDGTSGSGTGGSVLLNTFGAGGQSLTIGGSITLEAVGTGGIASGDSGSGGDGTGGTVSVFLSGGSFHADASGIFSLLSTGEGGVGPQAGSGVGGESNITGTGGIFTTGLATTITANGFSAAGGIAADGTGGRAGIVLDGTGSDFHFTGPVTISADGEAKDATAGTDGLGTGGAAQVFVRNGALRIDQPLSMSANAYGSDGVGGAAIGGNVSVEAHAGSILLNSVSASAFAVGGAGLDGDGGAATGMSIIVEAFSDPVTPSSIVMQSFSGNANATGGNGGSSNAEGASTGGRGGDATAGSATLNGRAFNGSVSVGSLQVSAVGKGGNGGNGAYGELTGGTGGDGGTGTGGFSQSGVVSSLVGAVLSGSAAFGPVTMTTNGIGGRGGNGAFGGTTGGAGGRGGDAAGGASYLISRGAQVTAEAVGLNSTALGGTGGTGSFNNDYSVQAARGDGGNAVGGVAAAAATPHFATGATGELTIASLTADASATGGDGRVGGNGIGGTARLSIETPLGVTFVTLAGMGTVTDQVLLYATGNGGAGFGPTGVGGNGTGGMAEVVVGNGMLDIGYGVLAAANGNGGFSNGDGYGTAGPHGVGTGGLAQFLANDSAVHIDQEVVLEANGFSYDNAFGGTSAFVTTLGTTTLTGSLGLRADAEGFNATSGQVTLQSDQGGSAIVAGSTAMTSEADGELTADSGSIKVLVGSGAALDLGSLATSGYSSADNATSGPTFLGISGGSLRVRGAVFLDESAQAGNDTNSTSNAQAGTVTISVGSGSLTFDGALSIKARAQGGSSEVFGGSGTGVGTGGTVTIATVDDAATVNLSSVEISVRGTGGFNGGRGEGGAAEINVGGGAVLVAGGLSVEAQGIGGSSEIGGHAFGGFARLIVQNGDLTVLGTTSLDVLATGGTGYSGSGGDAFGGVARITSIASTASTSFADVTIVASARGGDGGNEGSFGSGANGGFGVAGSIEVTANGPMTGGTLALDGTGRGGNGGSVYSSGETSGAGGDGYGSNILIGSTGSGTPAIYWSAISALASATGGNGGGATEIDGGVGGIGGGAGAGNITLQAPAGTVLNVGDISLIADAFSGNDGDSDTNLPLPGAARGGSIDVLVGGALTGGALSLSASASRDQTSVAPNTMYGQVKLRSLDGSVSLASASLQAYGQSPLYVTDSSEVSGVISIAGDLTVNTPGTVALRAERGDIRVGGSLLVDVGELQNFSSGTGIFNAGLVDAGLISISAVGGIALDSALRSASTLTVRAGSSIRLGNLAATGDILLQTQSSLMTGNIVGQAATTLLALQDISAGNIRSGGDIRLNGAGVISTGALSAGDSVFLTSTGDGRVATGAIDAGRSEPSGDPAASYDVLVDSYGAVSIGSIDAAGSVGVFSRTEAITIAGGVTAGRSVVLLATTDVTAGSIGTGDDNDMLIGSASMIELLRTGANGNPDYALILAGEPTPLGGSILLGGGVSTRNLTLASIGNIGVGGDIQTLLGGSISGGAVTLGNVVSAGVLGVFATGELQVGRVIGSSAVTLQASNDLTTGDVDSAADLSLVSLTGDILTGSAFAFNSGRLQIDAAGSVTTGTLFSANSMAVIGRAGSLSLGDVESGGSIALLARDEVSTGAIRAGGTTLIAASSMAELIGSDGNGGPDYTGLFTAPAVRIAGNLLVGGGIVTSALKLAAFGNLTVLGPIVSNTASFLGGAINLSDVTLGGALQIVTDQALVVGNLRSEQDIGLDATGSLAAGTISSGGSVFLAVRGTGGILATGDIDAGILRPSSGSSFGLLVDSSGAASLGVVNATGAVGIIGRGGNITTFAVTAGPSITMLGSGDIVTLGLQTVATGNVLFGSSSLASLLAYDSNGNPDYAGVLAAAPVRIAGDLLIGGPVATGNLSLAAQGTLKVDGAITADTSASFLGGAITLADVTLDGTLKIVTDQSLTVGNLRSENSILLDATGDILAGDISAGDSVTVTARGDGSVSAGRIAAGILRPSAGTAPRYAVFVDASGSLSTGSIDAVGTVGAIARSGSLGVGAVSAGPSVVLLAQNNATVGGVFTGNFGTALIASSSMASALGFDANGDPDYTALLTAAPVRMMGDLTVNGSISSGTLRLAAAGSLTAQGAIAGDMSASFLGGAITIGDVTLNGALQIVTDRALTVGNLRSEGSILLDAAGDMLAGDVSAGDLVRVTTSGTGNIVVGAIDAGILRPGTAGSASHSVFVDAAGSATTGTIAATGTVGIVARGGSIVTSAVAAGPGVTLLARDNVSSGGLQSDAILVAASSMATLMGSDSNLNPDYSALFTATPVRLAGKIRVNGGIDTGLLVLAGLGDVTVSGAIETAQDLSIIGRTVSLGSVTSGGGFEVTATQSLTAGSLRGEDDLFLNARGDINVASVSAADSVFITSLANVSTGDLDAGILRPSSDPTARLGILVDAAGSASTGTIRATGAAGIVARSGSAAVGSIDVGLSLGLLAGTDASAGAIHTGSSGTTLIAASSMAALIVEGSDGNPDYSALLTAGPVRLGGSILVSGPVTTGTLKLASFGGSSVESAITTTGAVGIAGGTVSLGNLAAGALIEVFADRTLTLGNVRGETSIDLEAGGNLTAGTISAGNSITIDTAVNELATGSISVGDLDAGVIRRFAGAGAAYQVGLSSNSSIATGGIVAGGNIGVLARGGGIALGSVATSGSLLLLAAHDIATGALTTGRGAADTVYAGSSSIEAQFPDAEFDPLAPLGGFDFTPVFALAPLRAGGAVTLGGAIVTGRLTAASTGNFSVGAVDARTSATIDSGAAAIFNGLVVAPQISVRSADIVIGQSGGLGSIATTQLTLSIDPSASAISLGGAGRTGWSLDNSEAGKLRASSIVVAASSNAAPVVTVGTLALGGGGSFRIQTPGSIRVTGKVALASTAATDSLQLDAGQLIEVVTDSGGALELSDGSGKIAGRLDLAATDVRVGTSALLAQLAINQDFTGRAVELARQPAAPNLAGALGADRMTVLARHSFLIQNSGDATQRAGFSVGPGGLQISNGGSANPTDIVLNGRATTAAGVVLINDATFAQVSVPATIVATSTLNGCLFAVSCAPVVPVEPVPPLTPLAVIERIDQVVATIGTQIAAVVDGAPVDGIAAISDTPEAGADATPEEKKAAEAAEKLPNVRVSRLIDVSAVASPANVDEAITSGGNSSLWGGGTSRPIDGMPSGGPK